MDQQLLDIKMFDESLLVPKDMFSKDGKFEVIKHLPATIKLNLTQCNQGP